ncbi:SAM-dependent methyltransferase [Actinomadura sp. SCN-SB]|uniref:SAM-dependent methyltransferase n=1 Tax=Actinomadura sp. SCN-SB TaxID=3373092 RepID=UPI003752A803
MIVDFRPHARLRGKKPLDIGKAVTPVLEALRDEDADLGRVRVVYDWVQYRNNFRDVVDVRPILSASPAPKDPSQEWPVPVPVGVRDDDMEIAVDVRRSGDHPLRELTSARLHDADDRDLYLEDWGPGRESCIWAFNSLYWSALRVWEKATGREYEQALPGGESDARNRDGARELIGDLFAVWDRLSETGALPEQLYVVEFGVGNGNQARVFLDEFRELDRAHGKEYYRRLHYLMCDNSPHVLDLARENVADHAERVSSFALDATRPCTSLGFLRYKVFLIYISNVYDNLPTDEVAHLGGRTYLVQTRAYLPADGAAGLAEDVGLAPEDLPGLVHRLLRLGPSLLADADPARFPDVNSAVEFWQKAWSLVRLKERYVPLAGLDLYELAPSVSGETLRPLLESGADVRMHVNNGALASFTDSLSLLHPYGKLVCHDLFVTDVQGYRTSFRGPGKYDGSVVNWVNGPLLAHVGRRKGFEVRYAPFRHRGGGNIVTMTAQVRD